MKKFKKIGKKNRKILKEHLKVSSIIEREIPKFLNPLLFYYVGDRLFKYQANGHIVNQTIFNNN